MASDDSKTHDGELEAPKSVTATEKLADEKAAELPKEFQPMPTLNDDEKDFVRQASRVGMAMTELRIVLALARMANMKPMDYQAKVWMNIKTGILQVLTQEATGIIQ